MIKKMFTLSQAAKKLNVSNITICNWANEGKIKFIILPGSARRRYILDDILEEKKSPKIETGSSTPEYPQANNETTWNDRSFPSEKNTQSINLSRTLEVESTIRKKDFGHWWTSLCKEMSQKLWLPIETDCAVSDTKYSNFFSKNMIPNSWFSITKNVPKRKSSSKIYSPSLPSFPVGLTDLENIKNKSKKTLTRKKIKKVKMKRKKKPVEGIQRTKIYRFYPTKEQKIIFGNWFKVARDCYNKIIELLETETSLFSDKRERYHLRDKVIKEVNDIYGVNLEIKKNAVQEAFDAIDNGGNNFGYRSCKDKSSSLYVRTSCVSTKKNTIFPCTFPVINLKKKKLFKPESDGMTKVVKKFNKYYIHINEVRCQGVDWDIFSGRESACALDPGTHTFNTYWSPSSCGKIAAEGGVEIFGLCRRIDRLLSKKSGLTGKKKSNLSRAIRKTRTVLTNKVDDLHWKSASFLCENYDNVFLPSFETKGMSAKKKRKITSKTARKMLTLSHFKFQQRLVSKAMEKSVSILMLDEPYTSQLCSGCFTLNKKLKLCERTYDCNNCKIRIDRDYNGARNIYFRGFELFRARGLLPSCDGRCPLSCEDKTVLDSMMLN